MINTVLTKFKNHRFFSEFFTPESFGQFKRYVVTGFISFASEYCLYLLLLKIAGLGYNLSHSITLTVIFWLNFLMNRIWSFRSRKNLKKQLITYSFLFAFNIIVTNLLISLFTVNIGLAPELSKILVMGAVVSWNFIIYKKIIYK